MNNALKQLTAFVIALAIMISIPSFAAAQKTNGKTAAAPAAPSFGNVDGISAKQLKEYLTFIASDELEGRDTPSRGLDIAAMYIAQHLASWGIKPAGDNGSYFQKVPLTLDKVVARDTRLDLGGQSYEYGKDFLTSITGASINEAQIVFAGYGWVIKSKNINAFQGIDVKDKIVVVVNSLPKGITFGDLKGPPGGDWMSPAFYAQTNGAKAIINFPTFGNLINWESSRWNQSDKGSVSFGNQPPLIRIPTITASPRLLSALFFGEKATATAIFNKTQTLDEQAVFDLKPEKRISVNIAAKTEAIHTQNVVGILEGTDPVLKNEYVAIGAHYDHVGMNPFAPGPDKIWNGADDDGSGTVAVMSIAEAFAKGAVKPKRSILFIWHAGEEKGLWGSEYFSNHPTVPITSIITELNIDMIGRYQAPGEENHPQNKRLPKPHEVFTIGSKMMSTELGEISDSVNRSFLNLSFNLTYDGPDHPDQFFYRSDHFNYAKKGIPIIFYMDGDHADYHQVSDSVEKINFEQMEKVARTIMATGWTLANRAARPKVDKPLPASVTGN
jgi:hypothetical protein